MAKKTSKLSETELRYKYLFESMPQGVVYQDKTGAIIEANAAALKILGLTYDQLCGKTSYDSNWKAIKEDGSDFLGETHPSIEALKTGFPVKDTIMGVFNAKENNYRWIQINAFPIFGDASKEPIQVFTTFDDITERKGAEQKLKESEEKFFKIFQSSPNAILLSRLSDYKILNVNASIHTITGYTSEDLIGKKHSQFNIWKSEDDREFFTDQMVKNGSVKDFEAEFIHKSGEIRIWRTSGEIIEIRGEKFVLGIISDITELRGAEIELKESEEKFRMLIENSQVGIFLDDKNGNATYINERCADIVGLPLDKALDLDWVPSIHPDDRETVTLKWANAIKNGIPFKEEYRWVHADGKVVWSQGTIEPVFDDNGNVTLFIGTLIDITERKHAETATKKQTYLLTKAQEIGNIGTWEYDIEKDELTWTQENYKIFGVDEETPLTYELFLSTIYQEDRDFVDKAWTEGVKSNNYDIEHRIIVNDEVRWVREKAQFSYNDSGQPIKAIGLTQDITSYKALTKELKDNEEKFSKIFSSSPNSIILTRLSNFEIVNANEATLHITGYALSDIIGKTQSEFDVWKSADERILFGQQLIKNGKVKDFEAEFVTKSGEDRIWKTSGEIVQINNEKYILGIIEDVTEMRIAELELKRQSEFIHTMTENQPAGIVACDAVGKLVLFNKAAKEWHGIDILKISQDQWAENYGLYREDGKTILEMDDIPLIKAFKGKKVENYEMVIKAVGQKPRLVSCNGASFFEKSGKRLGAVIVMTDITQERIIENNLKKSESDLRKALMEVERNEFLLNEAGRMAKIGAWEFDLATQKTRWSDQVFELHGIAKGEVPDFDFIMSCYIDGSEEILRNAIEECINQKKKYELELRFENARKEKLWVKAIGYPIMNEKDEIVSLRGVVQDITEQKKKENELKFSEKRFRAMIEGAPDPIFIQTNKCFAYLNKHAVNLFGAKDEKELIGKPVLDFFHPDFHKAALERIKKLNSDKTLVPEPFEQILIKLNGKEVWVETKGEPIFFNNENGGLVFIRDISFRKNAEKELRDSEKRYKTLFENQPTIIWEEDFSDLKKQFDDLKKEGVEDFNIYFDQHPEVVKELAAKVKVVEVNSTGIEILEAESKEDIVKNIPYYFDSDEAWLKFKEELVALAHGEVSFQCEIPIRTVKGNSKTLYLKLIVHPDYTNDLKKVVVTFQDISEIKKAEKELRDSEYKLKELLNNLDSGIVIHAADTSIIFNNQKAAEILRSSYDKITGKHVFDYPWNFLNEDGSILSLEDYPVNQILKRKEGIKNMVIGMNHKENTIWAILSGFPVFNEKREIIEVVTSFIDITAQVEANLRLTENEAELKMALTEIERSEFFLNETGKLSKIGGWDLDLTTMTPYFSEETYRIYEIPHGKPPKLEDGILFYPIEARELVQKAVSDAIEKHINYDIEVPFITAKGKHIWVRTIGQVQVKEGVAIRLFGTIQDITNLKKTQLEIEKTNDLLEAITNNLPGAVIQYKMNSDGSDALTYVSSGSNEIWGIKPEEALKDNSKIWNQIDKNSIDEVNDSLQKSYLNLSPWNVEFKSKLPNGKNKWIQGIGTPKKIDDSVIWSSIMLDITNRKEADESIKKYQESLQKLTIELSLIEEKQRKDIAANIHDHLSQSLVISKMKVREFIKKNNSSLNVQDLTTVIQHLSDAIENSRKITYDLSPPVLYELGLIETLYWLAEKTQKEHGLKVSFNTNQEYLKLSEKELILIFRTIQELINNTIKHAKATELIIKLNIQVTLFEILIADNGIGFDEDLGIKTEKNNTGFGLFSVKERIQNLFGTIDFDTAIGKGTRVKITFPLNSSKYN